MLAHTEQAECGVFCPNIRFGRFKRMEDTIRIVNFDKKITVARFNYDVESPFGFIAFIDEFAAELDKYQFSDPQIPVIANVTGDYVRTAAEVKDALRRQVAGSVRWTDTMRRLAADGYDTFVEVGPGRVLTGMNMRINPDLPAYGTEDQRRLDAFLAKVGS